MLTKLTLYYLKYYAHLSLIIRIKLTPNYYKQINNLLQSLFVMLIQS
jgi:hypothetical protein